MSYEFHLFIEIDGSNFILGPVNAEKFKREITDYLKTTKTFPFWPWPKMQKLVSFTDGDGTGKKKVIVSFNYKAKYVNGGAKDLDEKVIKEIVAKHFVNREEKQPVEKLKEVDLDQIRVGLFYAQFQL